MNYIKKYRKHFNIGDQDIVYCKVCGLLAVDLHHIVFRSRGGTDEVSNLILLCRDCHNKAHSRELTEKQLYDYANR